MTHDYPSIHEAIALHDALIEEFGGAHGIRDEGALASAIMRPQMGYYDNLIEEAAALLESLTMNHPFLDGNKRTALAATDVFLGLNGHYIDCDSLETYAFFMQLFETNSFRFAELKTWLEEHVKPLPGFQHPGGA